MQRSCPSYSINTTTLDDVSESDDLDEERDKFDTLTTSSTFLDMLPDEVCLSMSFCVAQPDGP